MLQCPFRKMPFFQITGDWLRASATGSQKQRPCHRLCTYPQGLQHKCVWQKVVYLQLVLISTHSHSFQRSGADLYPSGYLIPSCGTGMSVYTKQAWSIFTTTALPKVVPLDKTHNLHRGCNPNVKRRKSAR